MALRISFESRDIMNAYLLLPLFVIPAIPILGSLYHLAFTKAIDDAIEESQGKRCFHRWLLPLLVFLALMLYAFTARLFEPPYLEKLSFPSWFLCCLGTLYLALEIPYQLVKTAAKDKLDIILTLREGKFQKMNQESAELRAKLARLRLKLDAELENFSSDEPLVFLNAEEKS
jgi:hypothetical protein